MDNPGSRSRCRQIWGSEPFHLPFPLQPNWKEIGAAEVGLRRVEGFAASPSSAGSRCSDRDHLRVRSSGFGKVSPFPSLIPNVLQLCAPPSRLGLGILL